MSSTRRILLIAVALGLATSAVGAPVTFTYVPFEGEEVESVSLRGTMNNWGETPMERQPDGSWSVTVELDPGEHLYKFFINGQWPKDMESDHDGDPLDLEAESYVDDNYGGQNAVRSIGAHVLSHKGVRVSRHAQRKTHQREHGGACRQRRGAGVRVVP